MEICPKDFQDDKRKVKNKNKDLTTSGSFIVIIIMVNPPGPFWLYSGKVNLLLGPSRIPSWKFPKCRG
jgi:hypothetical protein